MIAPIMNPSLLKYSQLYVTTPCDCDYNSPLKSETFRRLDNDYTLRSGIFINIRTTGASSDDKKIILYQSVDGNYFAQWLALQNHSLTAFNVQQVLQYQACINCTSSQLADVLSGRIPLERSLRSISDINYICIVACGKS